MPPRKRIIKLVCFLLLTGCVLGVGLRGAYRGRELQRRFVCASNLKGIETAAMISEVNWDGTTPIIDWLVQTGQIDPMSAKCPCADSPNYVILTPPIGVENDDIPVDNMVVAYEPKSNHGGEGGNVVFGDGHAEFVRVPAYDELVSSVAKSNP